MRACQEFSLTPLGVLLENMKLWHERALNLEAQVQHLIDTASDEKTLEQTRVLLVAAHERAVKYAIAAAPYCHPKLQAVAFKTEANRVVREMTHDMTTVEKQKAYAEQLRLNPFPA